MKEYAPGLFFAAVVLLLIVAISFVLSKEIPIDPSLDENVDLIRYLQDRRTGLCFATTANTFTVQEATLTHVPCTTEVLAHIR